jgi:Ser/Thr protein kinase RdoA (MazF antagonist)
VTAISNLKEAASLFFTEPYAFSWLGGSSGFSTSHFARVIDRSGATWCLRQWPVSFDERRLHFIHQVLTHSHAHGFSGVPRLAVTASGKTLCRLNGSLIDAQEWLEGVPSGPQHKRVEPIPNMVYSLAPLQLTQLAAALASFHLSTDLLLQGEGAEYLPLVHYLAELITETQAHHERLITKITAQARTDEAHAIALRWLTLIPEALELAQAVLDSEPEGAYAVNTLCHGDLWPPHVYFVGGEFRGLVDFESLCYSSVALDLAQLILHCGSWYAQERVISTYEMRRALSKADKAVLPAAAALDLASEGYWSLMMLYESEESQLPREAHHINLRTLLASLELLLKGLYQLAS